MYPISSSNNVDGNNSNISDKNDKSKTSFQGKVGKGNVKRSQQQLNSSSHTCSHHPDDCKATTMTITLKSGKTVKVNFPNEAPTQTECEKMMKESNSPEVFLSKLENSRWKINITHDQP